VSAIPQNATAAVTSINTVTHIEGATPITSSDIAIERGDGGSHLLRRRHPADRQVFRAATGRQMRRNHSGGITIKSAVAVFD
jgi:hypothetical protein